MKKKHTGDVKRVTSPQGDTESADMALGTPEPIWSWIWQGIQLVKGKKNGFYRCISSKRETMENVGLLLSEGRDMVQRRTWKRVRKSNLCFAFVCTGETHLQQSQATETHGKVWGKEELLSQEEDQFREHLNKTGHTEIHKTWWEIPTNADGAWWCQCKATLDNLWKGEIPED